VNKLLGLLVLALAFALTLGTVGCQKKDEEKKETDGKKKETEKKETEKKETETKKKETEKKETETKKEDAKLKVKDISGELLLKKTGQDPSYG